MFNKRKTHSLKGGSRNAVNVRVRNLLKSGVQTGGAKHQYPFPYKIYEIKNIAKSNVAMKVSSKFINNDDEKLDSYTTISYRISNSTNYPGLLFLERFQRYWNPHKSPGQDHRHEIKYYVRKNDLTDEQITNSSNPKRLFDGADKVGVWDIGTLEEIIKAIPTGSAIDRQALRVQNGGACSYCGTGRCICKK